jgi:hypothetical protein
VDNSSIMIIIFWEMTPCGSYKNRRFGGTYRLHLQGARVRAVLIRATRCHLPEDDNHHSHRRGNLKSYNSSIVDCYTLLTLFCIGRDVADLKTGRKLSSYCTGSDQLMVDNHLLEFCLSVTYIGRFYIAERVLAL